MLHRWVGLILPVLLIVLAGPVVQGGNSLASSNGTDLRMRDVTGTLGLNRPIEVDIENLKAFLEEPEKEARKFVLYLDNRVIEGLQSTWISGTDKLRFDVRRTSESRDQWAYLLGNPIGKGLEYPVLVSVGYEDETPIPSNVEYPLRVVGKFEVTISIILLIIVGATFIYFAKTTGIIREPEPSNNARQRRYSLGRTQMALWLFAIVGAYLLIWLLTGDADTITESTLALMGISGATALGASVVGDTKKNEARSELKELNKQIEELDHKERILSATMGPAGQSSLLAIQIAEAQTRKNLLNQEAAKLAPASTERPSSRFLTDILSDSAGLTLHRFQMLIWTIILLVVFVGSAYERLMMPQFSGTLLALMGISGGTYIGFKWPEKS